MSTTRASVQDLMTDQVVDMSLELTAKMFGLSKETVSTIMRVGLPMMAKMVETHPELFQRMHAASLATLPEPVQDFYTNMVQNPALRQATMDDYKATYGTMLDAVNRAAARQAGTTDGQARDVLAAALPAISEALGQANTTGSTHGFAKALKDLQT